MAVADKRMHDAAQSSGAVADVVVGVDGSGGDWDAAAWTSPDGLAWSRVPHDEPVFGGPGTLEGRFRLDGSGALDGRLRLAACYNEITPGEMVRRPDDVPGHLVPSLYFDYVRAGRVAPLLAEPAPQDPDLPVGGRQVRGRVQRGLHLVQPGQQPLRVHGVNQREDPERLPGLVPL